MNPPCVVKNHNGQTALFVNKGTKYSWVIPMDSGGLTVVKQTHKQVIDEWKLLPYDITVAAWMFTNTPFSKTELVTAILSNLTEHHYNFEALD